jgi:hypothetical protein
MLLQGLSDWLDRAGDSEHWVPDCRNRIVQVRETFGSLDDFEGILGKLEDYGHRRVRPAGPTTCRQDTKDIFHDCTERIRGVDRGDPDTPAEGFYPQYLRSDLIMALCEFFHQIEQGRTGTAAYGGFAARVDPGSLIVTLNYDVARERSLCRRTPQRRPETTIGLLHSIRTCLSATRNSITLPRTRPASNQPVGAPSALHGSMSR